MKKFLARIFTGLAGLSTAFGAAAAVVYSHALTPTGGSTSDADGSIFIFDRFLLGANAVVNEVWWKGMYFSAGTPQAVDNFTVKFHADGSGAPGSEIGSFNVGNMVNRTRTGIFFGGSFEFYAYDASLAAGIALNAGTTYWISIFNDTGVDAGDTWFWGTDRSSTTGFMKQGERFYRAATYDFVLLRNDFVAAAVPEPGSVALLALGLAGLGFGRRPGRT